MIAMRRLMSVASLFAVVWCTACVPSKHPLSDDATSIVDEALLGNWSMSIEGEPLGQAPAGRCVISRQRSARHTLTCVVVELDDGGEAAVEWADFYTTNIAGMRLMSWPRQSWPGGGESEKSNGTAADYDVLLYEQPDNDTVRIYMLDMNVIDKAVLAGQLPGETELRRSLFSQRRVVLRVTASPDEWREFIAQRGKKLFDMSFAVLTLSRSNEAR